MSEKSFLVQLAKQTLLDYVAGRPIVGQPRKINHACKLRRGVFVSLFHNGKLIGQAGQLISLEPAWVNLIKNTVKAGQKANLVGQAIKNKCLKIEILVIQPPQQLFFASGSDLISHLKTNKLGFVLKAGNRQAYSLPDKSIGVSQAENLLSRLCLGLKINPLAWQDPKQVQVFTFKAKRFTTSLTLNPSRASL